MSRTHLGWNHLMDFILQQVISKFTHQYCYCGNDQILHNIIAHVWPHWQYGRNYKEARIHKKNKGHGYSLYSIKLTYDPLFVKTINHNYYVTGPLVQWHIFTIHMLPSTIIFKRCQYRYDQQWNPLHSTHTWGRHWQIRPTHKGWPIF